MNIPLTRHILVLCALFLAGLQPVLGQMRSLGPEEIATRLPLLTEINFENFNPAHDPAVIRPGGMTVWSPRLAQCPSSLCSADPSNPANGNVILLLRRGESMSFTEWPRFLIFDVQGAGPGSFQLRVRDGAGRHYRFDGLSPNNGGAYIGMEATRGISVVELASVGTVCEGLGIASVFVHNVPPPTHLLARPVSTAQVNLTWQYSATNQTNFTVERSTGSPSDFVEIATVDPHGRSAADLTVSTNTRYFYRIRADHPAGPSAYSNTASARTDLPETRLVFRSLAAEDGYICENFEFSDRGGTVTSGDDTLIVGDLAADSQCKAILSFNTAPIPDTVEIISAILVLPEAGRSGTPFATLGPLNLEISLRPGFGAAALDRLDFEAVAMRVDTVTEQTGADGSHSVSLGPRARTLINKNGRTQFRLSFANPDNDNTLPDNVTFHSGEHLENRPTLEIIYRRR